MHLDSNAHEPFIVRCSTLRTFGDYIALKIFTIIKTQTVYSSVYATEYATIISCCLYKGNYLELYFNTFL